LVVFCALVLRAKCAIKTLLARTDGGGAGNNF